MPDRYYICTDCGHFWSQLWAPSQCENCPSRLLTSCLSVGRAGEISQRIIDAKEKPRHAA